MDKLTEIIKKIFSVVPEDINDKMSPKTIPNWDSMNYLLFISDVEKEFNVTFTVDEIMEAKTLGDIKKCLSDKGVSL
jgi:acyl carrier protein